METVVIAQVFAIFMLSVCTRMYCKHTFIPKLHVLEKNVNKGQNDSAKNKGRRSGYLVTDVMGEIPEKRRRRMHM